MQPKNIYQRLSQVVNAVETIQIAIDQPVIPQNLVKTLHLYLTKAGIIMIPVVVELRHNGLRSVVKMEISFINIDNPSDKIQVQYFGYGMSLHDSGVTSAITCAVNNALLKIFCMETVDNLEVNHPVLRSENTQKISKEEQKRILELTKSNPQKLERVLKLLQVQDVADIQKINYEEIIASFTKDIHHRTT